MKKNLTVHRLEAMEAGLPEGKRIPFGWRAAAIGMSPQAGLKLAWQGGGEEGPAWLRITVALDVREELQVAAFSGASGVPLGQFDIQYASVLQPYQILLDAEQAALAGQEGVELRLSRGQSTLWIFANAAQGAELFAPHLLPASEDACEPWVRLSKMLSSLSSLQPFGWLEGCVLDGLLDLFAATGEVRYRDAAAAHLAMFWVEDGELRYENPRSEPVDGRIYGIEGTLPFAALAKVDPNHPAITQALQFWLSQRGPDGVIWDGAILSAEGSYTIAYPLAVMARLYARRDLASLAIDQLEARMRHLVVEEALYLRYHEDGSRSFRQWSRAYAWYILGLARTLHELSALPWLFSVEQKRVNSLRLELARLAELVMEYQSPEGLWYSFLDDPATGVETSGSSAIAASLAIGVRLGILGENALTSSLLAKCALEPYISQDGVLHGVTPNNKNGEDLQRKGYRILSLMGTGLAAQLEAAVRLAQQKK